MRKKPIQWLSCSKPMPTTTHPCKTSWPPTPLARLPTKPSAKRLFAPKTTTFAASLQRSAGRPNTIGQATCPTSKPRLTMAKEAGSLPPTSAFTRQISPTSWVKTGPHPSALTGLRRCSRLSQNTMPPACSAFMPIPSQFPPSACCPRCKKPPRITRWPQPPKSRSKASMATWCRVAPRL